MGIGLNSPANRKKHAPRGTFTLHKNSEEEATAEYMAQKPFEEYPKYIAEADQVATDAAHEQAIRASLPAEAPKDEKPAKGKKADKDAAA